MGDRLTPTERRIAQAVLEEPTLLAFGTVSDLAARVGTSRPSIVRFATKLGFDGYTSLQTHVRRGLSDQLARPSDRIRNEHAGRERDEIAAGIDSVFEAIDQGRFEIFSKLIVKAKRVWVATGETSRAGGYALQSGLTMVRPGVRLVRDHNIGRDLADAGPDDVAVLFDFFRYRRATVKAAETLAAVGTTIIAVTDGPLSPLAALTEHWCQVIVPAVGPFDSSLPAVAAAELLVAQVTRDLKDEARDRIDRTEALWESTGTFCP
ncbi:MAG: SIS domain-containing protein [Acidobacteria bacterium]|nr:SIS domain-containing protein [Acidobacteriota bacterium]NIO59422.1 SIS domain-containing protein [Acidobacteriota bacterium]NIQ30457.1 SIS domain-containing protein [Acidobacteriota bacterium]NIT11133.1 SIS domain-containing protein [Acidobacteriota bacterium]